MINKMYFPFTIFFAFYALLIISSAESASNYFGKFLGPLKSYHHGLGGDVYVVDSRTLHIRNFNYDGEGPAGYFYVSNGKTPNENGIKLRDERGSTGPLKKYRKKHITLTLPEGKTTTNIKWFYVWCDEFAVNFGDVKIPKNLDFPKPQKIGKLSGVHGVSSDNIVVVDAQTLLIPGFSYDGEAPDAKFWVGSGNKPSPQGIRVPDENGKEEPLRKYDRKTIVLTLPGDLTVFEIGHFGIWCEAFTVDFGHIQIPKDLNIPPSLKMLGVSPQKITRSIRSQFDGDVPVGSYSLYSELPEFEDTDTTFSEKLETLYDEPILSSTNHRDSYSSKRDRVSNYSKRNSTRLTSANRVQKENGGYQYPTANSSRGTTTPSPKPANGHGDMTVAILPDNKENQEDSGNVQIIKAIGTEYEAESGPSYGWPSGKDNDGRVILSTGSLIDINGKNKPNGNPNSELEDDAEGPYPSRGNGKGNGNGQSSSGPYPARVKGNGNGNGKSNGNGQDAGGPYPARANGNGNANGKSNGNGQDARGPYPARANGNGKSNGNGQDGGGPYPARANSNGNGKSISNGQDSGGPYPARANGNGNGNSKNNANGQDPGGPYPTRTNGNGNGNVKSNGNGQDPGGPYPARISSKSNGNGNGAVKLEKATSYLPPSGDDVDDESVDGNFGEKVEKPANGVPKSDRVISLVPESTNDNHNRNGIRQLLFNKDNSPSFETNNKNGNNANPGVSDIVLQSHFFGSASDVVSSISIPFNYDDSDKTPQVNVVKDSSSSGSFGQNASPFVYHSHKHLYTDTDENKNSDDISSSISNAIYSFTSD